MLYLSLLCNTLLLLHCKPIKIKIKASDLLLVNQGNIVTWKWNAINFWHVLLHVKVAAMPLKLEMRLHAYQVGTNLW